VEAVAAPRTGEPEPADALHLLYLLLRLDVAAQVEFESNV
jgi:hypothetical protein